MLALVPLMAAITVFAAPPAGAADQPTHDQIVAQAQQAVNTFNDDCSRANPPDECQKTPQLKIFKMCGLFAQTQPACEVVVQNVSNAPATNVVISDILRPRSVQFGPVYLILPPWSVSLCQSSANTARCNAGTLQPGEFVVVFAFFQCPSSINGGVNTASASARNIENPVTTKATFICR